MTSEENTNEDLSVRNENILNHTNKENEDIVHHNTMSVIIGRALPDVRDGLKPVHRLSSTGCMKEVTFLTENTVNPHVQ